MFVLIITHELVHALLEEKSLLAEGRLPSKESSQRPPLRPARAPGESEEGAG